MGILRFSRFTHSTADRNLSFRAPVFFCEKSYRNITKNRDPSSLYYVENTTKRSIPIGAQNGYKKTYTISKNISHLKMFKNDPKSLFFKVVSLWKMFKMKILKNTQNLCFSRGYPFENFENWSKIYVFQRGIPLKNV